MAMDTPTQREIEELVEFLPRLYPEPLDATGRRRAPVGQHLSLFSHEYDSVTEEFFRLASKPCWRDSDYGAKNAGAMLEEDGVVERADMGQIKTMLTFCARGERFSAGHWATMIEEGYIFRILHRLKQLIGVS